MPYLLHILTLFSIYLPVVAGFNLNLGFRGISNFAITAFFGLGSYIALICLIANLSLFETFGAVGLSVVILAVLVCKMSFKLNSDNLALCLFTLLLVIQNIVINWKSLTGGSFGLSIFSVDQKTQELRWFLQNISWLSMFYSLCVLLVCITISKSKIALTWRSSRDNLKLSESLGQNQEAWRILNITLSAIVSAFAGVFYAVYVGYVDPSLFGLNLLVLVMSMAVLGGLESLKGTVFGVFILIVLPEILRFLPITSSEIAPLRNILYGLLLLACLIYKPYGIFGKFKIE